MVDVVNGWNEWAKHVLETLKDLKGQNRETDDRLEQLRLDITRMEGEIKKDIALINQKLAIRSMAWASIPSAIAVIIAILLKFL